MSNENQNRARRRDPVRIKFGKIMQCLCSGEQPRGAELVPVSESPAMKDYSASLFSSRPGENERKPDTGNIEEAEISLRESGCLNYEVVFLITLTRNIFRFFGLS